MQSLILSTIFSERIGAGLHLPLMIALRAAKRSPANVLFRVKRDSPAEFVLRAEIRSVLDSFQYMCLAQDPVKRHLLFLKVKLISDSRHKGHRL